MLSPTLLDRIRTYLDRWETPVLWMYLDSEGLVTVGCGTMLPTAVSASVIPFFHDKTLKAATASEIEAEWTSLASGAATQKTALPKSKYAFGHYKGHSDLRITKGTADKLRDTHINADYQQLKSIYPKFDSFPADARVALFDMIYNLGPGHGKSPHHRATGLRAYATMNAAINKGDWKAASANCTRHGIPLERNRATAALFLNCAAPVATRRLPWLIA